MPTILSSNYPKARKEHRCDYCDGIIKVGETYQSDFLKSDGGVYGWKSHLRCSSIASKLDMFDGCDDGLTGDEFREYIKEEYPGCYEKTHPETFETDPIPDFFEQLDFVCNYHLKESK